MNSKSNNRFILSGHVHVKSIDYIDTTISCYRDGSAKKLTNKSSRDNQLSTAVPTLPFKHFIYTCAIKFMLL